jgi:hypothetical protein
MYEWGVLHYVLTTLMQDIYSLGTTLREDSTRHCGCLISCFASTGDSRTEIAGLESNHAPLTRKHVVNHLNSNILVLSIPT